MTDQEEVFVAHWELHAETFNFWIERHERLQSGMAVLKPLKPLFIAGNPTVNITGCQDCLIDMLIWCRMEYKRLNQNLKTYEPRNRKRTK